MYVSASDVAPMLRQRTQAVEAERSVVEEVADVAWLGRHGAEGVRAAGGEGVDADEQHVHQQGPGVAVGQEVHREAQPAEPPQEVPAQQQQQQPVVYFCQECLEQSTQLDLLLLDF